MANGNNHQSGGEGIPSGTRYGLGRKWSKHKLLAVVPVVLIVCVLVLGLAMAGERLAYRGKIYPGVKVAETGLGSKTPRQAGDFLRRHAASAVPEKIELSGAGAKKQVLDSGRLGIELDAEKSAQRAYVVGRQGWIGERLLRMAEANFGRVDLKAAVSFHPKAARAAVEGLARELDANARDASVSVEGAKVRVNEARKGYKLNVAATLANVHRAAQSSGREARIAAQILRPKVPTSAAKSTARKINEALAQPLVLESGGQNWVFKPSQTGQMLKISTEGSRLGVSVNREGLERVARNMFSSLNVEPKSASYNVSGNSVAVVPSRPGRQLRESELLASLDEGLFSGKHTFSVLTRIMQPSLSTRKAQQLKPTTLIGSYKTDYTWDEEPGQMANYRISSNAVNNTLVAPGQVFSFDGKTANLSYEPSKVIVNGQVTEALGGGLCQISTTLYMAANYADLKILERHPHYAQLPYIRPGLDATVWFGSGRDYSGRLDMSFRNNTKSYLLLKEWVSSDGNVYAQIWGRPTGKHVNVWSKEVASGPDYTKWVTYKKVTEDGKVLFDGILHEDVYQPLSV